MCHSYIGWDPLKSHLGSHRGTIKDGIQHLLIIHQRAYCRGLHDSTPKRHNLPFKLRHLWSYINWKLHPETRLGRWNRYSSQIWEGNKHDGPQISTSKLWHGNMQWQASERGADFCEGGQVCNLKHKLGTSFLYTFANWLCKIWRRLGKLKARATKVFLIYFCNLFL